MSSSVIIHTFRDTAVRANARASAVLTATLSAAAKADFAASASLRAHLSTPARAAMTAHTALSVALRSNFPTVVFRANASLTAAPRVVVRGESTGRAAAYLFVNLQPQSAFEETLNLFVTIVPASLNQANSRVLRSTARLLKNGASVPIKSFNYSEPANSLSKTLSVQLASPNIAITPGDSLQFDLGVISASGQTSWFPLLKNGKLTGSNSSLSWANNAPADQLSFTASNDDLFRKTPNNPITVFDPAKIELPATSETEIYLESGARIVAQNIAVAGLNLYEALRRAYVVGCGFSAVKTNLPNYPIARVDFSFESGFHNGVSGLVGQFEPTFFVDNQNSLWILDKSNSLPAGFAPREISISKYKVVNKTSAIADLDAIVLSVTEDDSSSDFYRVTQRQTRTESGVYGTNGFTQTTRRETVRQYFNFETPNQVVREIVEQTAQTTLDFNFSLIGREILIDDFDFSGRKKGHLRTVEAAMPTIVLGDSQLQLAEREECKVDYKPNPKNLREYNLERITTLVSGLILIDRDNQYLGKPSKIPYTDAHRGERIDLDADQSTEFGSILTRTENYVDRGNGEIEVNTKTTDHLKNFPRETKSVPRIGNLSQNANRARKTRQIIVGDNLSNKSRESFHAGELPAADAVALVRRRFLRRKANKHDLRVELVGIDLSLQKGAAVKLTARDAANLGDYLIAGRSITGENLGTAQQNIAQSLETEEI